MEIKIRESWTEREATISFNRKDIRLFSAGDEETITDAIGYLKNLNGKSEEDLPPVSHTKVAFRNSEAGRPDCALTVAGDRVYYSRFSESGKLIEKEMFSAGEFFAAFDSREIEEIPDVDGEFTER